MYGDYLKISCEALDDLMKRFFINKRGKITKKIIKSCSD